MDNNNDKICELNNLSRKSLVVKGNPLIQARFDELSAIEYKIIITALSTNSSQNEILDTISFKAKDFCELLKIQTVGMYSYLKKACDNLIKKTITIETDKKNWIKFSWLQKIEYRDGTILLKFNPELEPFLLFCKENKTYTKYFLENVIDMEGKYSIHLYELTKQYETIGTRTFEINDLKKMLGIPKNKYVKLSHLKTKVLLPSKTEVNGLSDIDIDFNLIKEGRKFTKIQYIIKRKSFNMHNTSEYDMLPKMKLIARLRKKIYDTTGFYLEISILNNYHRIILIELLKKFDTKIFNSVIIQYPKAFFKWHLDDINNNYDQEQLWKIKKDF